MIEIRRSDERGHFDHGWLQTYHTFSFDQYYDPKHQRFRTLRVMNEDRIAAGGGFPTHPHRDMEIITYLIDGELAHEDSMGSSSVIQRHDVQRMSAGSGILHSEFNSSHIASTHLYQIWILPSEKNLTPEYEQKQFTDADKQGRLCLMVSPDGRNGSLTLHQDLLLYSSLLQPEETLEYTLQMGGYAWIQIVRGKLELSGQILSRGDGASLRDETELGLRAIEPVELLLFDLA